VVVDELDVGELEAAFPARCSESLIRAQLVGAGSIRLAERAGRAKI
jgi:hypothetical protein